MKQATFSLIILTVLTVGCFAQQIESRVVDLQGKPIAFASVGVPALKIGTVADEKGRFTLIISKALPAQQLLVSAVGYQPQEFTIASLRESVPAAVRLAERIMQLRDVSVVSKRSKAHRLGNKPGGVANISFGGESLGTELGIPIRLKQAALIKEVNIILDDNYSDSLQIRINFYALIDGKPGENLLRRSIVATLPAGKQLFSKDISAEQLVLQNDFVLAVELVNMYGKKNFGQVFFKAGVTNGPTFIRVSSQAPWEKADDGPFNIGAAFSVIAFY